MLRGANRVRDQTRGLTIALAGLNGETSRAKVRNVREDSSVRYLDGQTHNLAAAPAAEMMKGFFLSK